MPCSDQVSDEWIYTQAAVFLSMPVAIYIHSKTRIRHVELPPSEVTLLFIVFWSCSLRTLGKPYGRPWWLASYPGSSPCRKAGREPGRSDHVCVVSLPFLGTHVQWTSFAYIYQQSKASPLYLKEIECIASLCTITVLVFSFSTVVLSNSEALHWSNTHGYYFLHQYVQWRLFWIASLQLVNF